ncbi:MAG: fibronectin type III domain-containing protein [bacterium]|nr:fibronectin type III domain-containing protein [bacterium]
MIATVGIDETSYEDFSAAPGEEYEYRVRAFNGCGTGTASTVTYGYRVAVNPIVFGVATVTETLFGCMAAEVFDGDNDGDPDVIATGMFADQIVAYENNGSWASRHTSSSTTGTAPEALTWPTSTAMVTMMRRRWHSLRIN